MDPQNKPIVPTSEPQSILVNGALVPDADTVRSMLWTLSQKMKDDPRLAEAFRTDPHRVLGEIGLNNEIQRQAIKDLGVELPEGCVFSDCVLTDYCIATNCFVTNIVVSP
jgi:hypothetical protein